MRSLYLTLITAALLGLAACEKNETKPEIIIEPRPTRLVSKDSVFSGEKWGMTIGESAENAYSAIKDLKFKDPVTYISVSSVFTSLDGLENKIPLYAALMLGDANNTSTYIQIAFVNGTVGSIWAPDGKKLKQWPLNADKNTAIVTGDAVESIYAKLVKLKGISSVADQIKYISLQGKDTAKPYDPDMSRLAGWQFYAKVDDTFYYIIDLKLKDEKLISVHSTLYELL